MPNEYFESPAKKSIGYELAGLLMTFISLPVGFARLYFAVVAGLWQDRMRTREWRVQWWGGTGVALLLLAGFFALVWKAATNAMTGDFGILYWMLGVWLVIALVLYVAQRALEKAEAEELEHY